MGLPEGLVTMLFTDIENSTLHLRALGPAYANVLADQRRIMRAAIAANDGHEMGTEGDSFFVVFDSPASGVASAIDAQRELHANAWPAGNSIRVRMGVHVGELARHEEGYVGLELNRAARIASTANGGQVVVSAPLWGAIDGSREDVRVVDLGLHRLKDLPEPEHLYRLIVEGLPDVDTPVKSLGAPTNLPAFRARPVGRTREIDDVQRLLADGARVVTLTGPGGVGKTTLSLAVAAAMDTVFSAGVYFVPLEHAHESDEAWSAIAGALGCRDEGVPRDAVLSFLQGTRCLVVGDNLEQLSSAGALVADLVDRTPCSVIATSRGPLHIRGEVPYAVQPLGVPSEAADLAVMTSEPAVELFEREARRAKPSFEITAVNIATVVDIISKVEGLPLAIELVASRVRVLGLDAIARALEDRILISSRDVDRPDRQRTISATVAWSHDLLDADLQGAFARLSVFSGGGSVAAVSEVLSAAALDPLDVLEALADVGLVALVDGPDGTPRMTMLRVVREFASDRLDAGNMADDARRAHAAHFSSFVEIAADLLRKTDYLAWSDKLSMEQDNVRAAFEWSIRSLHDRVFAVRIAAALGWFWYAHGRGTEGRGYLERAARDGGVVDAELEWKVTFNLGVLQQQQGENDAAIGSFERALHGARAMADESKVARTLNSLGIAHWAEGRNDLARLHLIESAAIARDTGEEARLSTALSNLGLVHLTAAQPDEAVQAFREALSIDERLDDTWAVAVDHANLGLAVVMRGDLRNGHEMLAGALAGAVELDDPDLLASAIEACAIVAAKAGDGRTMVELVGGADRIRSEAKVPRAPTEDLFLEREFGPARASLGREAADAALAAGRAMTVDELVAVATNDVKSAIAAYQVAPDES